MAFVFAKVKIYGILYIISRRPYMIKIEDNDIIAIARKGTTDTREYFEIYRYDIDDNKFRDITADVSELTGNKMSTAKGHNGEIIMNGGGVDLGRELMQNMHMASNRVHGVETEHDSTYYFNKPKIEVHAYNKKNEAQQEAYSIISNGWDSPNVSQLEHVLPTGEQRDQIIAGVVNKAGLNDNIETSVKAVESDPYIFKYMSENMRNEPQVADKHLEKTGYNAEYRSIGAELKNNDEYMEAKIKEGHQALFRSASENVRNNPEIAKEVVKDSWYALGQCGDELRNNKQFVLDVVKVEPRAIDSAGDGIKQLCSVSGDNNIKTLETAIDIEKKGLKVSNEKSVFEQKEKIDLAEKISSEFAEKDRIKNEYYSKLGGGQSQERKMKM